MENTGTTAGNATLILNQAALGIQVKKLWEQFVQCQGGTLNAETGALTLRNLQPGANIVYIDLN